MARKYLLALRARLPGVAFRDRSGGFPKSWEFDVVVSLIAGQHELKQLCLAREPVPASESKQKKPERRGRRSE